MNPSDRDKEIDIGEADTLEERVNIRGYNVPYVIITNNASHEAHIIICDDNFAWQSSGHFHHLQFRWLQTVTQSAHSNRDRVLLDNVSISVLTLTQRREILVDDFNNQTEIK